MKAISKEKKIERAAKLPRNLKSWPPFFSLLMMSSLFLMGTFVSIKANAALVEEYSEEERKAYVKELLSLGDTLFDQKIYDQALAAYEQVFMLDPQNKKASAKIDILKKQMVKEGKDEVNVVNQVYQQEADERTKRYWAEARDYLQEKKYGQARFSLEKILLLDPFNKEAKDLYEKIKATPAQEVAAKYEKREAL